MNPKQKILEQVRANGAQVTALREQVLDILLQQSGVIKAYAVLGLMQQQSDGPVAPPTAYRALDFWADQGVLHKLAAVNGYMLCSHFRHECDAACHVHPHEEDKPGQQHNSMILVCMACGAVDEQSLSAEWVELQKKIMATGFTLQEEHVVLTGICQKCHQ